VVAEALKDRFDRNVIDELARRVAAEYESFAAAAFTEELVAGFPSLELKDRVSLVADRLRAHLPDHYLDALAIVVAVAESGPDEWAGWPLCSFVERHGVDWPAESLAAMTTLTQVWSCEFAIRPFLDQHLDLTRDYLRRCVDDEREAVRRLPSEGTRPLLPWGPRVAALTEDPQIGIELITGLRHDPSETVRRSVANHLNDVAKAHPDLVVDLLGGWVADGVDDRLVRHALRTLVKRGHPGAMRLLGYSAEPDVRIDSFRCSPSLLALGERITLTAAMTSESSDEQRLVVDFVIHHVNAAGETSPKVFKWTTVELAPRATVELTKRRQIVTASTRRYRAGHHRVDLQVAGRVVATTGFGLTNGSGDV
jgi:3-methyladenine DNA glycosylase AlkC